MEMESEGMGVRDMIDKKWFQNAHTKIDELKSNFEAPEKEYRPYMFWFWIDEKPEKESYRHQVEEMAKKGISSGYVQDRGFIELQKTGFDCKWMSNQKTYFDFFDIALEETKKNGLSMGYCEPARLLMSEEFYTDHEELMEISLKCEAFVVKAGERRSFEIPFFAVAVRMSDGMLDSEHMELLEGEKIHFEAKEADYKIFVFDKFTACTMEGSPVNLLDKKIGEYTWNMIHKPYLERYAAEAGKTLSGHFFDWEGDYGYKLCYSEDFDRAYTEKTGRSLKLNCPLLLEKDKQGKWMRARYDWYEVMSELYSAFNFKYPSDKLAENGMYYTLHLWEERLMGQALLAGNPMQIYRDVTMPGIDHLGKDHWRSRTYKEAQSVCELDGKRLACEILSVCGWELKPQDLHSSINNALAHSVSHFIPHGMYSNRKDIRKARYAPDFFEWLPMWEMFKDCTDYITRGSYLISQGRICADVAIYNPLESVWALLGDGAFDEKTSYEKGWVYDKRNLEDDFEYGAEIMRMDETYVNTIENLTKAGVSHLVVDKYYMERMQVADGTLGYKDFQFQTLILPSMRILKLDIARTILEFAKSGGTVYCLGYLPEASAENGAADPEMMSIMAELEKQQNFAYAAEGIERVIGKKMKPEITFLKGDFPIRVQKRIIDGHYFYWLSNDTDNMQKCEILLEGQEGRIVKWNLENGERENIQSRKETQGLVFSYEFAVAEGFFIEIIPEKPDFATKISKETEMVELDGKWHIYYDEKCQPVSTGYEQKLPENLKQGIESELKSWDALGAGEFSGFLEYEKEFILESDVEKIEITLEDVRYFVTASIDDEVEKRRIWAPYHFAFEGDFKAGVHKLHLHVGNTLINHLNPHRFDEEKDYWPVCNPKASDFVSGLFDGIRIKIWEKEHK